MQTEFSKTPPFLSKNTQGFKKNPDLSINHPFSKTGLYQKPRPFIKNPGLLLKTRVFKNTGFFQQNKTRVHTYS